jgi:hypothetical protein
MFGRRDKALEEEYGTASKPYVDAAFQAQHHAAPGKGAQEVQAE